MHTTSYMVEKKYTYTFWTKFGHLIIKYMIVVFNCQTLAIVKGSWVNKSP